MSLKYTLSQLGSLTLRFDWGFQGSGGLLVCVGPGHGKNPLHEAAVVREAREGQASALLSRANNNLHGAVMEAFRGGGASATLWCTDFHALVRRLSKTLRARRRVASLVLDAA